MRYYTAESFRNLILSTSTDEALLQKLEDIRTSQTDIDEAFLNYLLTVIAGLTSPGEPGNENRVAAELHQRASWSLRLAQLINE